MKRQKKDLKKSSKCTQQQTKNSLSTISYGFDCMDLDEEVPDVDPTHEQLNLPPDSITLWKIMPKLEYASQVEFYDK